jgi:hypothetical protein
VYRPQGEYPLVSNKAAGGRPSDQAYLSAVQAAHFFGCKMNLSSDYYMKLGYKPVSLAHRGASPETIPKAERGVASAWHAAS